MFLFKTVEQIRIHLLYGVQDNYIALRQLEKAKWKRG